MVAEYGPSVVLKIATVPVLKIQYPYHCLVYRVFRIQSTVELVLLYE